MATRTRTRTKKKIEDGADTLSTLNDCENCGQHWRAYYELFGIEPVEEDE
jgi:hypothetical protein